MKPSFYVLLKRKCVHLTIFYLTIFFGVQLYPITGIACTELHDEWIICGIAEVPAVVVVRCHRNTRVSGQLMNRGKGFTFSSFSYLFDVPWTLVIIQKNK